MHRAKTLLIGWALVALSMHASDFDGARALEFTRKIVSFGPRPPGSPAMRKLQSYLIAELKRRKCEVIEDDFTSQTPLKPIAMKNIIAKFHGRSGRAVVFSGHYDTKSMPGTSFVGANDGGASAGLLLEMARALDGGDRQADVYLVWFDGEEAIAQWSATDGLYGSRHLAQKWSAEKVLPRIQALINVDMIGDKKLGILEEQNSSASLRKRVWSVAQRLGYGRYFLNQAGSVEDDHAPFLLQGVHALDLIDFDYGPQNAFWHTGQDTVDKLGAESFQVVGTVLLETLKELEGAR